MLIVVLALQIIVLVAVVALLMRRAAVAAPAVDPRQAALPDQITGLRTRHEALDSALRNGLSEIRQETAREALQTREANARAFAELRGEVTGTIATLGQTVKAELTTFRADNAQAAGRLQADVHAQHDAIAQKLTSAASEARLQQEGAREALHTRLAELSAGNTAHLEKLRGTVGESLDRLSSANEKKLEEMRVTVDEKLHATLHTRLTESFGQVTDQLNKVHTGLGEMSKLSEGVDGLSRIFTNVKSRGGIGEVMLGKLISDVLAQTQFVHNAHVKPGSQEVVEYAIRFPGAHGEVLLPIDSKFPREDWERLESAYETGVQEAILSAGKAFEAAIRVQGRKICEKYINEPVTTPHAIMFLPTESLYAEIVRRDGLQADLQRNCRVTIAGPSTLSAILISFQMGFHMLNLQEKGDDVWKVLAATRTEFEKFGDLMVSMEKQVGTVQNTIQKLGVRTRAINRNLRDVSESESDATLNNLLGFEGVATRLAANAEDQ